MGQKEIKKRLHNNVLVINGDEFRAFHKYYDKIYQKYGESASEHTAKFAGEMVGKVRDKAIQERLNIVIEGTFRTVETPLKEIDNFKKNGYEPSIVVCTCPKSISWESTIKRAEAQIDANLQPRYVPKEHHDLVVDKLADNAQLIFDSGAVASFEIYSRTAKLFDSGVDKNKSIKDIINNELNSLSLDKSEQLEVKKLLTSKLEKEAILKPVEPISIKKLIDNENVVSHKIAKIKKIKR
ncbi:zeta toxin family protein [Phocoenobacter uteri]|uniref:zeta toxin family protein n=1 Tax=Phocoenobacter uteri TaxID=146806 RepID=UPI002440ED90|nr:zeta toxin family protein [Phocoenobacter uteri]MDG6882858.1 hypothetical protein [Phocoenobacter uteri]